MNILCTEILYYLATQNVYYLTVLVKEYVKGVRSQGRRTSTTQLVVTVRGSWRGYSPSPFLAGRVIPPDRRLEREKEDRIDDNLSSPVKVSITRLNSLHLQQKGKPIS